MSRNSTMGKLLSTFRYRRQLAREKINDDLWRSNDLKNPTKRDGHEIRQTEVTDKEGNTVIKSELWKKIDEKRIRISLKIEASEVKEEIGDLIND